MKCDPVTVLKMPKKNRPPLKGIHVIVVQVAPARYLYEATKVARAEKDAEERAVNFMKKNSWI